MKGPNCDSSCAGKLIRGSVIVGGFLGYLALANLVRQGKTEEVDHRVTTRLQKIKAPWFKRLMEIVSWPGFPPQSRIIPLVIPAGIRLTGHKREARYQLAAWGTSFLSGISKFFMNRPRPSNPDYEWGKGNVTGSSFPSGHVLAYIGVYGFLAYLVHLWGEPKWLRRLVEGILGSLVGLVGLSRLYLGHHHFSDVLASYLLGSSYLVALISLYRRSVCRDRRDQN